MWRVGITTVLVVAGFATTAVAAPLTEGPWLFQSNYGGGKKRLVRAYVEVTPTAATILSLDGNTVPKCSKGPKLRGALSYTAKKPQIAIVNSSFSTKWIKLVSYSGFSGKIKLKGTIDTNRIKGTLWFRAKLRTFGNCSIKEKFNVKRQATYTTT